MILLSALLLFPALQSNATAKSYSIQVAVGARDRRGTVVSFMLPEEARGKQLRLRGTRGQSVALQADMNGRAYFLFPNLKANST